MDGINPTLAFAVLLFGISGNAQDAANDTSTAVELGGPGCPALIIAGKPQEPANQQTWTEAFQEAAEASAVPDVIDPKWADAASAAENAVPSDEIALAMSGDKADPISRHTVPAGTYALAEDTVSDPCAPER